MSLNRLPAQLSGSGSPTSVAGQVSDQYHDTTVTGSLYICTTAGNPGTWQQVSGGGGSTTVEATNDTIVVTNPSSGVYSVAGGYVAGANITITGNSIASTGSSTLVVSNSGQGNLYGGDGKPASVANGMNNTTYGENAGILLTTGSQFNTLIGHGAGAILDTNDRVTAIGQSAAGNAYATNLIAIGPGSLNSVDGDFNIGIGDSTLNGGAGIHNVAIGYNAGLLCNNSSVTQNVMVGDYSGNTQTTYTQCVYVGCSADSNNDNLTNAGAFGYDTKISVSNAFNFGNGNLNAIGVNNSSPSQGFDPAPDSSNIWCYKFPPSATPTASSKGSLWMDSTSNNLNYMLPSGVFRSLNSGLNLVPTNIFQTTGNITVLNNYGQILLVGIVASGFSLIMPVPTFGQNPWGNGYYYDITVQYTNGVTGSSSIALLNSDSTPVLSFAGTAVVMAPGDTWRAYYRGNVTKGGAWPIGNATF